MSKLHVSDTRVSLPCFRCGKPEILSLLLLENYMVVNQLRNSRYMLNFDLNDVLYFYAMHICNGRRTELVYNCKKEMLYLRYRIDFAIQGDYDLFLELLAGYRLGLFDYFTTYNFHSKFIETDLPNLLAVTIGQKTKLKIQTHYLLVCRTDVKIYSTYHPKKELFYHYDDLSGKLGYYKYRNKNIVFEWNIDAIDDIFNKYVLNPEIAEKCTFQIKRVIGVYLLMNEEMKNSFENEKFIIVLCNGHRNY